MTEPDLTPDNLKTMTAGEILAAHKAGRIRPFTDDEKRLRKEAARAELMNKLEATNPALHKRITEGTTR